MLNVLNPFQFNPDAYLRANPDVADAVAAGLTTPQQHFRDFGQIEGRSPNPGAWQSFLLIAVAAFALYWFLVR